MKISEKVIEKQIIGYLWAKRILCTKVDTTGIYDAKKGIFRRPMGAYKRKGVSDIIGIYKGRFLSIEVKSESGRLSADQIRWLEDVHNNGGIVIVAKSVDDVVQALDEYDKAQAV